jgi:hypothetical protein
MAVVHSTASWAATPTWFVGFVLWFSFNTRAEEPAFQDMLRRLAQLCGHEPYPWKKRKGVFRFWIRDRHKLAGALGMSPFAKRDELIGRLQEEVRAAGFLLVSGDSVAKNPPLMLFPTNDSCAVVMACGTNGNRLIQVNGKPEFLDAGHVTRWLRDMATTHPFVVTECGFDHVGGRFLDKVTSALDLAKRMSAFCPDLGESPEQVALSLTTSQSFYFWWD